MADYYCQPGLYTYSATPGAGVAQEGDGTTTGTAAAATLSIDLTSATAAAGNTFTVAGAVLTCVATGAGNNQFNAGSGSTLASNLATAINRTTNTVTVNAAATNWDTPPLQNAVYAYASGATLYIQTRAGSATYNANSNFQVAQSGITGLTGPWQFADGVSGSWGWLFNDNVQGTIWPTAEAACTYGAFMSATKKRPLAGLVPTTSDIVNIRANDKELRLVTTSASVTVTATASSNWLVDDGTVWSGDSGTLTIRSTPGANYAGAVYFPLNGKTFFGAKTYGSLVLKLDGTGAGYYNVGLNGGASLGQALILAKIKFWEPSGTGAIRPFFGQDGATMTIIGCRFVYDPNLYNAPINMPTGSYGTIKLTVIDCEFEWTNYSGVPTALVTFSTGANILITLRRCRQISANPGPIFSTRGEGSVRLIAEDCAGFSQEGTLCDYVGTGNTTVGYFERGYALLQNIGGDRDFRLELASFYLDWFSGGGYPVADSYLPSGTAWSYRLYWSGTENTVRTGDPVTVLSLTKTNILADGTRTIAMELLLDDTYDHLVTDAHLALQIAYKRASDDATIFESTLLDPVEVFINGGDALPSSAKSWTLNDYTGYVARKLSITTTESVKADTEVEARLVVWRAAPTSYLYVFINPELTIT